MCIWLVTMQKMIEEDPAIYVNECQWLLFTILTSRLAFIRVHRRAPQPSGCFKFGCQIDAIVVAL